MTVRPPIVGAALWTTVMNNAGHRCECRGACGKKHSASGQRTQGRCDLENGKHISKRGEVVLLAMPRDPINEGDFATAASLPAHRLAAMCPDCYDAVRRKIARAIKELPPQEDELFGVEEFYVSKSSTKQADVGAA
jgi:hypothetical protein